MLHGQNQVQAKPAEHSRGRSGATQDGQSSEIYAELPGKGNNNAQEPLLEDAGKITCTGQEIRAAGSEEAVVRTKTKEGVEGEAKDARSITTEDRWKIRELNQNEVQSCTSDFK